MFRRLAHGLLLLALVARAAGAAPAETAPRRQTTSADVADAPRPDRARRVVRDDRSWARHLLWIPRGILFVPKWALWVGAAPVRGTMWVFDRYNLRERAARVLSGEGPVTLFPSARLESGLGITYGIAGAVSDALGADERLRLEFLFGGEVRQVYGGELKTGSLFGSRLGSDLEVELQLLKNSRYFGIGNDDDDSAVPSRFDQNIFRAELGVELRLPAHFTARASSAYITRSFDDPSDTSTTSAADVYDASELVGFDTGTGALYSELAATFDTRRQPSQYISVAEPSTGWKLDGFTGYAHGFDDDPSRYLRYGLDVQRYFDLYRHDRILVLRAGFEGVTAKLSEIPFTELPRLGSSRSMRAYTRGRFRDRYVSYAAAEYRYPINRFLQAFGFAEAGNAFRTPGDVWDAGPHPGYGGGIQLHTPGRFLMRAHVAYGDDGINLAVSFNPSFDVRHRTVRR